MDKIRTELIVLSEQKYKDSSKIIKAYTREAGKVSILAKGAMRGTSSLVAVTQPFSNSMCTLISGKSFYYINSSKIISSNYKLRNDYEVLIMANYLLELVDKTFLEGEINKKIFDLLKKTLILLQDSKNVLTLILAFELKYMSFLGYKPKFNMGEGINYFSVIEGGIVDFYNPAKQCYEVSIEHIQCLNDLLYTSLDEIKLYNKEVITYLQNIVIEYIKFNLDVKQFNSLLLI